MFSCAAVVRGCDSCTFCHREILLFREKTEDKVESSIALLEEMCRRRRSEMDPEMQGPAHQKCAHIGVPGSQGADKKA